MSYFLCLAVPPAVAGQLPTVFDKSIYQMDASILPIGSTTRGDNRSWSATILQVGSSSASLIGKAGVRKTHNNDHTGLLAAGIKALLEQEDCPSVSFVAHWMQGDITTEEIRLRGEKQIGISALQATLLQLEEDVRYTVLKGF